LRAAIQEEYKLVALEPERGFHFHTGRPLACLATRLSGWRTSLKPASNRSPARAIPFASVRYGRANRWWTWAAVPVWTA
jgi:hypothetical protein